MSCSSPLQVVGWFIASDAFLSSVSRKPSNSQRRLSSTGRPLKLDLEYILRAILCKAVLKKDPLSDPNSVSELERLVEDTEVVFRAVSPTHKPLV